MRALALLLVGLGVGLAALSPPAQASAPSAGISIQLLTPSRPGAIRAVGVADIPAPQAEVWQAVIDFPARKKGNPALAEVREYKPASGDQRWFRWTIAVLGFTVTYHNTYRLSEAEGRVHYQLDSEMENDLLYNDGKFFLKAISPTTTRLIYEVQTDFGEAVPKPAQEWMTGSGIRGFLQDILQRAKT